VIGVLGQVHPKAAEAFGADVELYAAQLDFEALLALSGGERTYVPLPRFPGVHRDLAVVCDASVTVLALEKCIRAAGGSLLKTADFFDVYTGAPIPAGQKSVAFSLEFRSDEKSLTDADVEPLMAAILDRLGKELDARLR
jgi:phenylalanyl-tRNA synthetase beta chain